MKKVGIEGTVRVDAYAVVARAVGEGIAYGWRRAYKHTETPHEDEVREMIQQAVMNELCEVLRFEPGERE